MVYWSLWESAKTHSCNQWQNRMPWNPIIPHSPSSVQFPLMEWSSPLLALPTSCSGEGEQGIAGSGLGGTTSVPLTYCWDNGVDLIYHRLWLLPTFSQKGSTENTNSSKYVNKLPWRPRAGPKCSDKITQTICLKNSCLRLWPSDQSKFLSSPQSSND